MASVAFAMGSVAKSMVTYSRERNVADWNGFTGDSQAAFANWINQHFPELLQLDTDGTRSLTTNDPTLYGQAQSHLLNGKPPVEQLRGIGICSRAEHTIQWQSSQSVVLTTETVPGKGMQHYRATMLDGKPVEIIRYLIPGTPSGVIRIRLDNGDWLWLSDYPRKPGALELGLKTENLVSLVAQGDIETQTINKLIVPQFDFPHTVDPQALIGLQTKAGQHSRARHRHLSEIGTSVVTDTCMQVAVRLQSAKRRMASTFVNARSLGTEGIVVLDQPFRGAITRGYSTIPLTVFWVDPESWLHHR